MSLSIDWFHRVARLVGVVLAVMGIGPLALFVVYAATGASPLGEALPLSPPGMLLLGSVGALALPIGASLFVRDALSSTRLRLAAGMLGLMAVLRLAAFVSPELRAVLGAAPLVEFFVLGAVAAVAWVARPETESAIEIQLVFDLNAPACEVWHVLGERFGDVAEFSSGLRASSIDRPVGVGAVRTCEVPGFGPFAASTLTETLTEFSPEAMRYAYVAGGELPSFVPAARNRWSIEPLGPDRCRARTHASAEVAGWAAPLAPLLASAIRGQVAQFGRDLRHRVESPAG